MKLIPVMPGGRGFGHTNNTYVYADFANNQIILTGLETLLPKGTICTIR